MTNATYTPSDTNLPTGNTAYVDASDGRDAGAIRREHDGTYTTIQPHKMRSSFNHATLDAALEELARLDREDRAGLKPDKPIRASFHLDTYEALFLIETATELTIQQWYGTFGKTLAAFEHPGRSDAFYDALSAATDALRATGRNLLDDRDA